MGYSWFRVDSAFPDHPKTLALCAELNDMNAGMYIIRLWSWAQRYADDGRVDTKSRNEFEVSLGWRKEPGVLVAALIKTGFLDAKKGYFSVHDWDLHQAALVQKSQRDAELKAAQRKAAKAHQLRLVPQDGAETARAGRVPEKQPALATGRDVTDVTDVTGRSSGPKDNSPGAFVDAPPPLGNEISEADSRSLFDLFQIIRADFGRKKEERQPSGFHPWHRARRAEGHSFDELAAGFRHYHSDRSITSLGWPTAVFINDGIWVTRLPRLLPELKAQ